MYVSMLAEPRSSSQRGEEGHEAGRQRRATSQHPDERKANDETARRHLTQRTIPPPLSLAAPTGRGSSHGSPTPNAALAALIPESRAAAFANGFHRRRRRSTEPVHADLGSENSGAGIRIHCVPPNSSDVDADPGAQPSRIQRVGGCFVHGRTATFCGGANTRLLTIDAPRTGFGHTGGHTEADANVCLYSTHCATIDRDEVLRLG